MKALVVLVAVLSGCVRTVEQREIIVERLIDPAPQARALPRCLALPALGDTTGWRREVDQPVALPPEFAPDPEGLAREQPIHGGRYWKDASRRTFRRIDGHWDVSEHPDACHAMVNGALMVIVASADSTGRWVDAWPVSRSARTTARFDAVGFDPADQQLFLRILQTYRSPESDD